MQGNNVLIDANILLRYFLDDDHEQALEAKQIIEDHDCIVLTEILQEVLYILEKHAGMPRNEIKDMIEDTFDTLLFPDEKEVSLALQVYTESPKLDFPDCLLYAYGITKGCMVKTFDKKLQRKPDSRTE